MKIRRFCLAGFALLPSLTLAQQGIHLMDTRTFVKLMVDEFEVTDVADENDFDWDAELSVGGDLHKFVMTTEGGSGDGGTDTSELQFLYSKAITPFWNLQAGLRAEDDSASNRDWAVVSLKGLAPYFFEIEAELFFADGGQSGFRVKGEYEVLLTQRWILSHELELLGYGHKDSIGSNGSGVSNLEFNVRLRYEIKRELAPYFGISWNRFYGDAKAFAQSAGRDVTGARLVVGLRTWF